MSAHLHRLLAWFDALSLRERAIIAVATLLVVWGAWTVLSWDAIDAERLRAEQRLEAARADLTALGERSARALAVKRADPDHGSRDERDRLQAQLAQLDAELARRGDQLVSPEQMVGALRALLAEQRGLTLERLELQAPVSALAAEPDAARALPEAIPLYKHVVEMEWRGGYFDSLRYLRAVERLGWALYWESLDYEVETHPEARVRLRLFTLSEQEGWIGV